MIEVIFWKNNDQLYLELINNPMDMDDAILGEPAGVCRLPYCQPGMSVP